MGEELWQVLNEPIEIELSGRKWKARMLPLKSVFAWAESKAVNEAIANIQAVAASLSGKDKVDYLVGATKDLPSGRELQEKASAKLYSLDAMTELFFQSLKPDQQDLTREQVVSLVEDNLESLQGLVPSLIKGNMTGKK